MYKVSTNSGAVLEIRSKLSTCLGFIGINNCNINWISGNKNLLSYSINGSSMVFNKTLLLVMVMINHENGSTSSDIDLGAAAMTASILDKTVTLYSLVN